MTRDEVRGEKLAALVAMHEQIGTRDSKWATELEGSYIPMDALCHYTPLGRCIPISTG